MGLRAACLALEIDDFGRYREQHGDLAADRILIQVAERIEGVLPLCPCSCRGSTRRYSLRRWPRSAADLESMIQLSARLQHAGPGGTPADERTSPFCDSVGGIPRRRDGHRTGLASRDAAELALVEAQSSGTVLSADRPQPRMKRVVRAGLVVEVADALDGGQIKPWFQPQIST